MLRYYEPHIVDRTNGFHVQQNAQLVQVLPAQLTEGLIKDANVLSTWLSHLALWKRIAASPGVSVIGEDEWHINSTFDRDFYACLELMHGFSNNDPVCLWLGFYIPLEYRIVYMMNTNTRKVVTVNQHATGSRPQEGNFAYILNSAFAAHLVREFEKSPLKSIEISVDQWMLKQIPQKQLTLEVPIVYAESPNAAAVCAKLSPMNQILNYANLRRA